MNLAIFDSLPQGNPIKTPFGQVTSQQFGPAGIILGYPAAPKALAYAAKACGASRAIAILRDSGLTRPVTPHDFIDFSSGRDTTFFEQIGTGYVQQQPPFCPDLSQALLTVGAEKGGVLLVVNELPPAGVRQWWQGQNIQLISVASQPEGLLCRELELCFAVLALPPHFDVAPLLEQVAGLLPAGRPCPCPNTMALARQSGRLPADWHHWF